MLEDIGESDTFVELVESGEGFFRLQVATV
jgi:hypothetical protein